jgi:hypothetical protein
MLLTRRTPHLKAYNSLSPLVQVYDDDENLATITSEMISKLLLISKILKKFQKTFVRPKSNKNDHMLQGEVSRCFWGSRKEKLL